MQDPVAVSNPDLTAAVVQISAFLSHLSVGGATAHAIEWAKSKPAIAKGWGVLSARGKAITGAVLAFFGSIGITFAFHSDPHQAGVYSIVIGGLTAQSIGTHAWSFTQSWLLQQGWYAAIIKPKSITGVPEKPLIIGVPPQPPPAPVPVVEVKP